MAEFLTALSQMLVSRRAALAAFIAGLVSLVGLFFNWLPPPREITFLVAFAAIFGLVIFLYPANFKRRWKAWRKRRANLAIGVENLSKLDAFETQSVKWIYHHGGRFRASEADRPLPELKNLHIIEREDPEQPYRDCILVVPKKVMRALRRMHGRRRADLGGGTPPWRQRGLGRI
jgi:hypothetical protein